MLGSGRSYYLHETPSTPGLCDHPDVPGSERAFHFYFLWLAEVWRTLERTSPEERGTAEVSARRKARTDQGTTVKTVAAGIPEGFRLLSPEGSFREVRERKGMPHRPSGPSWLSRRRRR